MISKAEQLIRWTVWQESAVAGAAPFGPGEPPEGVADQGVSPKYEVVEAPFPGCESHE